MSDIVEARPKIKPFQRLEEYKREWNGVGLPPVGTVCGIEFPFYEVERAEIVFIGRDVFIYKPVIGSGDAKEMAGQVDGAIFCLIKTEEEKAVEDIESILFKADVEACAQSTYTITAKALYKAGYRKVE